MKTISNPLLPPDKSGTSDLRQKAEKKAALSPEHNKCLSLNETRLMIHELHVHQIELEMQNEELRRAQEELNASRCAILTSTSSRRRGIAPSANRDCL